MMKRWNIMGTLAAALAAILLCAPCARATDQETAAYYKDVEVKVGVITAEAKVNMRREPNTKAGILVRIQPGETVDVLDDSDEKWLKVKYDGEVGYVSADFVEVSSYMDQQPVIIEDPLEVTASNLALPTLLEHRASYHRGYADQQQPDHRRVHRGEGRPFARNRDERVEIVRL